MDGSDKVNILVVDDQPGKLMSYEVILRGVGENVITASSGREALEQLLRNEVAVILMDVFMPDLDGFQLAAMVREHPRFKQVAIIFISAIHLGEMDHLRGYEMGAVDYVPVPVVPEVLRAKVKVFADLYRKTRQLEQLNRQLEERVRERTRELEASNAQLRESERSRTLALAAGRMGSWDWDVAAGTCIWDEGQCRICGVDPGSFAPGLETVRPLVDDGDWERLTGAFARLSNGDGSFQTELRVRRPRGDIRWCIATAVATFDAAERMVRLSGVTIDITDRKEAEARIHASEERLRLFVEQAPASIAMFDRDMRYLAVSRRWLSEFRPDDAGLVGRSHDEVWPQMPELWRERYRRALAGEVLAATAEPLEGSDGSMRWMSWELRPWFAADGAIGGIVIFADDVTSQHKAVVALKESEERYERLANASNEGVLIYDALRIIEANATFLRMFGYAKDELANKALGEFFPEQTRCQILERMRSRGNETYETLGLRKDGVTFPVELSGDFIRFHGRDVRVWLMRDLTEEKRAEEERRTLQSELFHAARLSEMGQMAAALAHELNQPLTAVATYLGGCRRILGSEVTNDGRKRQLEEAIEQAYTQVLRAGEIIRRLREFIGKGETERTIESAAKVMHEASVLAIAGANHRGVSIQTVIGQTGKILVNKVQIQQVLINLIRNAVEAMETTPRKELEIGLSTRGDWIEFRVCDTGSGLAREMTERLFKPFSTTKTHGMGIGLSVCRGIVEAHHGRIWAEPNPDGGTIFRFTLPLIRDQEVV